MSRPRLPQEVAQVTGAVSKNAGRFRSRSAPKVKSLGPAPKRFTDDQREIWDEFNADFPWLGRSDRRVVGLAVILQSEIDKGEAPVAVFAQMRMLLSAMGGTPVDRSKVVAPDEEEPDPADAFLN
ncbi:hypothetical protein [Sulfitobacter sp.]|uniref:hypothetical protein n=1 Tax=Sulfitobacter sp. TaxID=1903071 RepID=UPI003F6D6B86